MLRLHAQPFHTGSVRVHARVNVHVRVRVKRKLRVISNLFHNGNMRMCTNTNTKCTNKNQIDLIFWLSLVFELML
jgi:hypothetical protein